MKNNLTDARLMLSAAKRIVAFTGAGVSEESGIPTYRGQGGLWKEYDPGKYADINYFHQNPSYYWGFFRDVRYPAIDGAVPNAAHKTLARLEQNGQLTGVITQNIDGLHQEAGSQTVIELHGNTRIIGCLDCGAEFDYRSVFAAIETTFPPKCSHCEGLLKPNVVFFGESLPPGAMDLAISQAQQCDLMLVVGSTLEVYPAASLPLIAKEAGAKVIVVNVGPTAMDELADLHLDAKAGETLAQIV